ncbi:MAG: cyclase family protein [Desulfitobacteriaceae bacterium]
MQIVDLTLELSDGLKTYASHPALEIKDASTFASSRGRYIPPCNGFASKWLGLSDHSGTHIDAPSHFVENGDSIDQIPVEKLMGTAIMLDCSHKKPDELVTAYMLEEAEKRQGLYVESEDIVLVRTYEGLWGDDGFFKAKSFSEDAARWFAEKEVAIVGLDLANADESSNMARPVHLTLLSQSILIIENLCNLDQLPIHSRFTFICTPLRLKGATASPIRALALLDTQLI